MFDDGLESEFSQKKAKPAKVWSHVDREWIVPGEEKKKEKKVEKLENEDIVDEMLQSNMFGSDKISLKTIDDFLEKNRLDFNFNGQSLDNYFENLDKSMGDPRQAANQ